MSSVDEKITRIIKSIKQVNAINADEFELILAHTKIREELLNAIEPVLRRSLEVASGDVTLMFEEERKLLDVYASWDRHNRGRRRTAAELIEDAKDDTWNDEDQELLDE